MHEPLNESSPPATGDLRIILVGTQHPGNIGAAARAMKTMGLSRLVLVAPEKPLDDDAYRRSAGAEDVLDAAPVHATLAEAVADCRLVLGCTARSRRVQLNSWSRTWPPADCCGWPARGRWRWCSAASGPG